MNIFRRTGNNTGSNEIVRPGKARRRRMILLAALGLVTIYFASNAMSKEKAEKPVGPGSMLPEFTALDQHGNTFDIREKIGKQVLVIYFYPKDDSPGCTKEACAFRDQFEVFRDAGAFIIGISSQSVQSHKEFAEKHRLNYTLLSDEGSRIRRLFGVPTDFLGLIPGRVTYIAGKDGKVVYTFNSQVRAAEHVDKALEVVKSLK